MEQDNTHSDTPAEDWTRTRLAMAATGIAGGLAVWALVLHLPEAALNDRLQLALTVAVMGFFLELMALSGPVRLVRAAGPSAVVALAVTALMLWASLRFDTVSDFLEAGHPMVALFVICLVGTPFISVRLEHGRGAWRDYAALFQTAWTILVRGAAAALFTGVVWGVLGLSDALLNLVGIEVIDRIMDQEPMPFAITGGVMGLALAVAHEWRAYVSPHLVLRLLRLLVPLVVPVLALFLLAVAVRGMGLLGFGSETALLTAVAIGGVTLVTVSVDRDSAHQVRARVLTGGVRVLAVMLLPLAGLATWGIGVRVAAYGWTPERLLAALSVGMVLLYGAAYALAVLRGGDWGRRLRGANIALALLTLALAVLWLTPVLNAERISTRSQLARVLKGETAPETAALWEMTNDWGLAGRAALADLRQNQDYPGRARVLDLITQYENGGPRSESARESRLREGQATRLAALMPVRPVGTSLPVGAFAGLNDWDLTTALDACNRKLDDDRPGCVYLEVPFAPARHETQGVMLLRQEDDRVQTRVFALRDQVLTPMGQLLDLEQGGRPTPPLDVLRAALDGAYDIAPATVTVLRIGGFSLFPDN